MKRIRQAPNSRQTIRENLIGSRIGSSDYDPLRIDKKAIPLPTEEELKESARIIKEKMKKCFPDSRLVDKEGKFRVPIIYK